MPLRVISLNIEYSKHLPSVTAFLREQQADVVCLMEVLEPHVEELVQSAGASFSLYAPLTLFPYNDTHVPFGVLILSRVPVRNSGRRYYSRSEHDVPTFVMYDDETLARALVYVDAEKDGVIYRIGATHFTWTPTGEASEKQFIDFRALCKVIDSLEDIAFMGDFNAPRGGEIFDKLSERYRDNIPPKYVSSLDPHMHRAGALELMVDGLFTTNGYRAENVKLVPGVSDHCAIVADIEKVGT